MPEEIVMPRLSDTMQEGTIARWLKREGEAVKTGEPIMEVETDKATMELNSYYDGTIAKILLDDGGSAPVGQVVGILAKSGEDVQQVAAQAGGSNGTAAPSQEKPQAAQQAQGVQVPPPPQATPEALRQSGGAGAPPAQPTAQQPAAQQVGQAGGAPQETAREGAQAGAGGEIKASPLARVFAERTGVDLRQLAGQGSGPGGRIVRQDVEAAAQRPAPRPLPAPQAGQAPMVAAGPVAEQSYEDRELTRMRALIARNLALSKPGAPHIYLTADVEMDAALALRKQLNELVGSDERSRLSVNDLVNKAAALALRSHPELNSHWVEGPPPKVRYFQRVDLGFAVQAEDGLLVPVIRAADTKSLTQLAREAKDLYEKVRAGKRSPEDLSGGTFTVSNLGQWGIDEFQAVINPPQAGILAVGAASPKAVVRDGQVVVRTMMRVTISADHRVVDGVYAARYLQELKRLLEQPLSLVL